MVTSQGRNKVYGACVHVHVRDDRYNFLHYWCVCVSISFILLLFHNTDGVTSLFFPINTESYQQHQR